MRRLRLALCLIAPVLLGLAACELALPKIGGAGLGGPKAGGPVELAPDGAVVGDGATAGAITGGPIAVTPLDKGPGETGAVVAGAKPAAVVGAVIGGAGPAVVPKAEVEAEVVPEVEAEVEADPEPKAEVAPVVPEKSPETLICEGKGGTYAKVGESSARACVFPTRDAGKRCDSDKDCDGVCLARSQSCAPIKPLFGCNDILQDDGRQVTLCID